MALTNSSEVRVVSGLSNDETALAKAYLQGAVYSWVRDRPGDWFSARDLVGGANFYWEGTPLHVLYKKHVAAGKGNEAAIEAAGIDAGWLLKAVLDEDKRTFENQPGYVNSYRWVGNER